MNAINFFLVMSTLIFSSVTFADNCRISTDTWDLSELVYRKIDGPLHKIPLGPFGGLTNEVHKAAIFNDCKSGTEGKSTDYYLKYNGALGHQINHHSGSEYIVFAVPGVPGIGVSIDMKDPNRDWISLSEQEAKLVSYNGPTVGFKSRIQFHVVSDLKTGKYHVPRQKIAIVQGNRHGASPPYTPAVNIYFPETDITINASSCVLNVPSDVRLNDDISNTTPFSVSVNQCSGPVNIFTRFSDVTAPETVKEYVKNTGTAQGYSLKIETEDGKSVQLIPIGTNSNDGELSLGRLEAGGALIKEFQARIIENQSRKIPGTLEYGVIVGVAYR
jgi:type 1 fimbria pilin